MSFIETDGRSPRFLTRAQNRAITRESAPSSSKKWLSTDRRSARRTSARTSAAENVGQVTADEFPVPHELFRQVQRGLGAADVIDVIHYVVAAEYDVGSQIPQRDMQDHAPSRAVAKFADVGRDRRGGNGNERGVTQRRPNIIGNLYLDLVEAPPTLVLELLRAGFIPV